MADPAPGRATRLAALAFAALLVATFGAFFLASRLKNEPAVLDDLQRVKYFSPNGDGRRDSEPIAFTIDATDRAAVDIVDADGAQVKRVAGDVLVRPRRVVKVRWNGREDDGTRAPDGVYRVRVILRREGRSVLAPKPFNLDTRPPNPAVIVGDRPGPTIVAPGTPVGFRTRGAGSDTRPRFRVLRTDVSPPQTVRRFAGERGRRTYTWDGRTAAGAAAPPGTYLIAITASDKARNPATSPRLPLQPRAVEGRPGVTIRSLAVQPPVRAVRAGDPVSFRVDARGRAYSWRLRRLGTSRPASFGRKSARRTTLVVRAPRGPSGIYLLEVQSHGSNTAVPLAVQARTHVGPLVVLPMITWLGRDPVDSTGDGVPDVFGSGSPVRFPRAFDYRGGLPAGLASDVAPLLVWMDRQGLRYDLTTDLALSFDDEPAGRKGVLLAGAPEWVSRPVARRLRRFVSDGGRLALFGPRALRASVTVGDALLSRPTPVTDTDALGARLAAVRRLAPAPGGALPALTVLRDDAALGLLEGFPGELGGFSEVEELVSPGRGKVVTSVGEETAKLRPALSAVTMDKGLVIRVGLPEWVRRLQAGDASVTQITRNVIDLLRGVKPRARAAS